MAFCPQKSEYLFVLALVPVTPLRALFCWPILRVWAVGEWEEGGAAAGGRGHTQGLFQCCFSQMLQKTGLGLLPQGSPVLPGKDSTFPHPSFFSFSPDHRQLRPLEGKLLTDFLCVTHLQGQDLKSETEKQD